MPRGGVEAPPGARLDLCVRLPSLAVPRQSRREGRKFEQMAEGERIRKLDRNQPDESQFERESRRSLAILYNSPSPDKHLESGSDIRQPGTYRISRKLFIQRRKRNYDLADCFCIFNRREPVKTQKITRLLPVAC